MNKGTFLETSKNKTLFSSEDLLPYRSDYLSGGWKKDEIKINHVSVDKEKNIYVGNFSMLNFFVPPDGVFHFTVPLAFLCVAQLAIIGACIDLDLASKPGEVLLRRIEIKCKKLIQISEGIVVSIQLQNRLFLSTNVYYEGGISIGNDDFIGFGSFILPLPENYKHTAGKET